ncbi:MAG: ParA family protein [Planctomycetales bacterium]|nr:ParA family protein [Planctomycetales bacterium]
MGRIICIANQKGGVGKTSTAINLAVGLAKSGRRVLLVDLDPQCNATSGLGCRIAARHALLEDRPLREAIVASTTERLDVLPGSRSFRDVEMLAAAAPQESDRFAANLIGGMATYDYVMIDCPPSFGQLTQTALASSDEVLMPIQCEYFAMEGLAQMIEVIRQIMQRREGRLRFGGIVLTMYDAALELTGEVEAEVRDFFGEIVFETVIPRDVAVAEAPSHALSVLDYAPRSRGARAYTELCLELTETT